MTLTNEAKAILYVIGNKEAPKSGEVAQAVSLSLHATDFILEQMKQHDLVSECTDRLTLSPRGALLLNDLS